MQAAIVESAGRAPGIRNVEEPVAAIGEELVFVTAAALSHVTMSRAAGAHYSSAGAAGIGVDGVGRLADGRRVYFFLPRHPLGSMAERTVVASCHCVALPDGLTEIAAAAIANPGVSALAALTDRARLMPGETVLVNGATGAAGQLAVQLARHLGAGKIVATGRNPAALQRLAGMGADVTLLLEDDAAFAAVFAAGVDIVVDYLWGPSAERLLAAAARAGRDDAPLRYVEVGSASAPEMILPGAILRAAPIILMGGGIGSLSTDRLAEAATTLMQAAVEVGMGIPVRQVPLAEISGNWSMRASGPRTVFVTDLHGR